MNLLSLLTGSLTSDASVNSVSNKTGVSSTLTKSLLMLAIPMILKSLTKNAASGEGAGSLLSALAQHKDKRSMADQIAAADAEDGSKILGHVFGNDSINVINDLSQQTGMETADVNSVLSNIAPALLSGLSAANTAGVAANQTGSSADFSDMLSIFGGAQGESDLTSDMLGSLFSGGAQPKPQPSGLGGLLSGLLGGGAKEEDTTAFDGMGLLSAMMKLQ